MTDFPFSKYFLMSELVSKKTLQTWGKWSCWFLDARMPAYIDFMRDRFGVIYMNNWKWGGKMDSRGYRDIYDKDGAKFSQHRFGRATDMMFKSVSAEEVRQDIIQNWKTLYLPMGITTIESGTIHLHSDMRYIPDQKELFIVKP